MTRSSGGNRRADSWRKGMDTFLSVPAHFTDSPLIFPRSRIDRHRWPKLRREGKVGWRTGHWVIIVSRSRELFRSKEDTRSNLRSYNSNWHPEQGGSRWAYLCSRGWRREPIRTRSVGTKEAVARVYPRFSGDERHAGIDPRRAYHAPLIPPEIESLLSLSSSLLF